MNRTRFFKRLNEANYELLAFNPIARLLVLHQFQAPYKSMHL